MSYGKYRCTHTYVKIDKHACRRYLCTTKVYNRRTRTNVDAPLRRKTSFHFHSSLPLIGPVQWIKPAEPQISELYIISNI